MSERVLVTVADDAEIPDVVARLEAAGVTVEKVMQVLGIVVGTVAPGGVRAVAEIAGVAAVEPDRTVRLPPPDADIQDIQ